MRVSTKGLKLFKYNKNTGIWDYVRSVTKENANQWLSVFSKDEPSETFKLSKYPPKMRIKSNPDKKKIPEPKLVFSKDGLSYAWKISSKGFTSYGDTKKEAIENWINKRAISMEKINQVKKFGSRAKFKHKRLVSPKKFAKKSLRTIKRGRKRIIVGCPKGKYDVKRKVCRVGTRAQAVLTPKRNPEIHIDVGSHNVNPKDIYNYAIQASLDRTFKKWDTVGRTKKKETAFAYAKTFAKDHPYYYVKVVKEKYSVPKFS